MPSSSEQVVVFTDTNLATHIAIGVPPHFTAGEFKREIEKAHFSCFPSIGEIEVHGITVKRRSSFYHLPDTFPIRLAFQGLKGAWFLHAEVRPLIESDLQCSSQHKSSNDVKDIVIDTYNKDITSSIEKDVTSTQCVSVKTPPLEEHLKNAPQSNARRKLLVKSPIYSTPQTSKDEDEDTEVGEFIVRASKKLNVSACNNPSAVLLSRMRRQQSRFSVASVAKYIVFEISDRED